MRSRTASLILDRFRPPEGVLLTFLAVVVGTATGLCAVLLIRLIAVIQSLSFSSSAAFFPWLGDWVVVLVPVAGALVTGPLIALFAPEAKGHGVPQVIKALVLRGGKMRARVALGKIVASAICLGTGGSAGREGPVVQVGSTLGSTIGQWLHLSDERIKNLVACGAAAGIAAAFNAPIAGVVFTIEVLVSELKAAIFGNVVIAAVVASIISQVFLGAKPAFLVPPYQLSEPDAMLFCVLIGLSAPCAAICFIRMLDVSEKIFDCWRFPSALKPAVGALALGVLGLFCLKLSGPHAGPRFAQGFSALQDLPLVFGSGFFYIEEVLQGKSLMPGFFLLILLKPLATSLTLGSGNSGGVFAPSLFIGAVFGAFFGVVGNHFFPESIHSLGAFALVGMASVFAATDHAPLTAILLVFEMSGDYHLILPLMAGSITASLFSRWLHPDSIYSIRLSKEGIRLEQGHDLDIMQGVLVEEVMIADPVCARTSQSVADLFALVQDTHMQGFPVLDDNRRLAGFVTVRDMENGQERTQKSMLELTVGEIAVREPVTVFADEPVWAAIRKMSPRDLARLPVVKRSDPLQVVGLVRRNDIVRSYELGLMRKQQEQQQKDSMALRRLPGLQFDEITVAADSALAGKKLADCGLPPGLNVVTINREGRNIVPGGATIVQPGDRLTVLGDPEALRHVRADMLVDDRICKIESKIRPMG